MPLHRLAAYQKGSLIYWSRTADGTNWTLALTGRSLAQPSSCHGETRLANLHVSRPSGIRTRDEAFGRRSDSRASSAAGLPCFCALLRSGRRTAVCIYPLRFNHRDSRPECPICASSDRMAGLRHGAKGSEIGTTCCSSNSARTSLAAGLSE